MKLPERLTQNVITVVKGCRTGIVVVRGVKVAFFLCSTVTSTNNVQRTVSLFFYSGRCQWTVGRHSKNKTV